MIPMEGCRIVVKLFRPLFVCRVASDDRDAAGMRTGSIKKQVFVRVETVAATIVENRWLGLRSLLEQILYCDRSVHSEKGTNECGLATGD